MLQRFYDGLVILMPDIAYQDKDLFTYKWYVDDVLVGEEYRTEFWLDKTKKNVVKLITINKNDGLRSTSFKSFSSILPRNATSKCYEGFWFYINDSGGEGS